MPYELSVPRFALLLLRSRSVDRLADRWARGDRRSPAQVRTALHATGSKRFAVPGAPAEAPLSHLVLHAQDVYRPLGVPSPTDPDDARVVLQQLTTPAQRRSPPAELRDGLSFAATYSAWCWGEGPLVHGPGAALLPTLVGRTAALEDLSGDGVPELRRRLSRGGAAGQPSPAQGEAS